MFSTYWCEIFASKHDDDKTSALMIVTGYVR